MLFCNFFSTVIVAACVHTLFSVDESITYTTHFVQISSKETSVIDPVEENTGCTFHVPIVRSVVSTSGRTDMICSDDSLYIERSTVITPSSQESE